MESKHEVLWSDKKMWIKNMKPICYLYYKQVTSVFLTQQPRNCCHSNYGYLQDAIHSILIF